MLTEVDRQQQAMLDEIQRRLEAEEPCQIEVWRERWLVTLKNGRPLFAGKLDEGWWPSRDVTLNNPYQSQLVYVRGGENMPQICTRLVPPL